MHKKILKVIMITMIFTLSLAACGKEKQIENNTTNEIINSESQPQEEIVENDSDTSEDAVKNKTDEIIDDVEDEQKDNVSTDNIDIQDNDTADESVTEKEDTEEVIEESFNPDEYDGKIITVDNLDGYYNDFTSQSAFCTISKRNEDGTFHVSISWVKGDMQYDSWEMNISHDTETNRFIYSDCVYSKSKANDIGVIEATIQYENGTGFFKISDNGTTLLWTGAKEPECKECVFEPLLMD